jgi:hypothetical protein
MTETLTDHIADVGEPDGTVEVTVEYEIVRLLSEQLYASPLKAIEELVVNSWDADASQCRVYHAPNVAKDPPEMFAVVFDDGSGMTREQLEALWVVGSSPKRRDAADAARPRKWIGKFGIGKLASHAVAKHATYITRGSDGVIRALTVHFADFEKHRAGQKDSRDPVILPVRKYKTVGDLEGVPGFRPAIERVGLDIPTLEALGSWTLVVLEGPKDKVREATLGRLNWVLGTAMPSVSDFALTLNGDKVVSAKVRAKPVVSFTVADLDPQRIADLCEVTKQDWRVEGDALVCTEFPSGVRGQLSVYEKTIYRAETKSEDLARSEGFFIRVRKRLVAYNDPLFGLTPRVYEVFNRFVAELEADDLDQYIKAPRDDVEEVDGIRSFRELLRELFNEARERWAAWSTEQQIKGKEGERTYVQTRLVERPIADALSRETIDESDVPWTYIRTDLGEDDLDELISDLYAEGPARTRKYRYRYRDGGKQRPMVEFDPSDRTFWINADHDLIAEYSDKPDARRLLETLVTAEAMLEIYLREIDLPEAVVEHALQRRDQLLRSLAEDELYSLARVGSALREAANSSESLEIAFVAAVRALGFSARHIGGSGTPDGTADWAAVSDDMKTFTLEAKSSGDVPELGSLDFGAIAEHNKRTGIDRCWLLAPDYPGRDRGDDSAVAWRSTIVGASCWTIDMLAQVVEKAEARHITAEQISKIVYEAATPDEVESRVAALLAEPVRDRRELVARCLELLEGLQPLASGSPTVERVIGALYSDGYKLDPDEVREAVLDLARASRGLVHVTDNDEIILRGDLDEIRRRTASVTGGDSLPRRQGTWRDRHPVGDDAVDDPS